MLVEEHRVMHMYVHTIMYSTRKQGYQVALNWLQSLHLLLEYHLRLPLLLIAQSQLAHDRAKAGFQQGKN